MFSFQTLLSKIQGSSTIDFGDLFNESVTLFKKVWVQGLILQLIINFNYASFYHRSFIFLILNLF